MEAEKIYESCPGRQLAGEVEYSTTRLKSYTLYCKETSHCNDLVYMCTVSIGFTFPIQADSYTNKRN